MIIKDIPEFNEKKAKIAWLVENKERLIKMGKAQMKHADGIPYAASNAIGGIIKATGTGSTKTELDAKVIINTTNLMDSHDDVHIPGIWDKSLKENKMIIHLREHKMAFDMIIADMDELKAYAAMYSWKELGFDFKGETQALVFDSNIKSERNAFMFNQYLKGYVKNHSVGMYYVRLILAVNDDSYGAEWDAWNKYFDVIANPERAEDKGYFWAVPEAKVIEGSAVPLGSNFATPTQEIKTQTPDDSTSGDSQPEISTEDFKSIIKSEFKKLKLN